MPSEWARPASILLLAPTLPFLPVVLGTGLLCAALAALSLQSGRYP